jgi:hypothetical protein
MFFSSRLFSIAGVEALTPPDSEEDMTLRQEIEPAQDPSPGPELEDQEHLSGRQTRKASAQLEPCHPPTVIAKLRSGAFKKSARKISASWGEGATILQCPLGHNLMK